MGLAESNPSNWRIIQLREAYVRDELTLHELEQCLAEVLRGEQPVHPRTGLPVIADPELVQMVEVL